MTLVGSAAFRSVPGVLMDPLHMEFGWSHGTIGLAVSVNMVLFGLIPLFAASLMDRLGIRPVVTGALLLIALGERPDGVRDRCLAGGYLLGASWWGVGAGSMSHGLRRHGRQPLVRRPARSGQRDPRRPGNATGQ